MSCIRLFDWKGNLMKEIIFPDSEYIITENYTKKLSETAWWNLLFELHNMVIKLGDFWDCDFGFTGFKPVEGNLTLVSGKIITIPKAVLKER